MFSKVLFLIALISISAASPIPADAQGSPIPGHGSSGDNRDGQNATDQLFGTPANSKRGTYRSLPISDSEARLKIEELKVLLPQSRPQDMQDSVFNLVEWLQDAAEAHYRMYLAFSKNEATKREAAAEKQLNANFSQLKREAMLLKADILIRENRAPEALGPLVDLVSADPRGLVGKDAYKRLVNLGFCKEPQAEPAAISASK